jgi:cbb3-type cytochrome oxidase subunit 1
LRNLPVYFIGLATVFALIGMAYGMYMAGSQDHSLTGAHAHNNLLGWVTIAIYGLYYAAVPPAISRLATIHFWVTLVANLIFPIGIGMAILGQTPAVAAIGGGLEIIAMLIFAFTVWTSRAAITMRAAE